MHALEWWFNGGPFAIPWFGLWAIVGIVITAWLFWWDGHQH